MKAGQIFLFFGRLTRAQHIFCLSGRTSSQKVKEAAPERTKKQWDCVYFAENTNPKKGEFIKEIFEFFCKVKNKFLDGERVLHFLLLLKNWWNAMVLRERASLGYCPDTKK